MVVFNIGQKNTANQLVTEYRSKLGIWEKFKHYWSNRKAATKSAEQLRGLKSRLRRLEKERFSRKTALIQLLVKAAIERSSTFEVIVQAQKHFESMSRISDCSKRNVSLCENALSKIRSALSAVSSSTTMEIFDLGTKNKGIAFASTLANLEANDAIDDVNRSLNTLADALEEQSKLSHDLVNVELVDLFMDLSSINDGFDFGSVFSLLKLSKATESLKEIDAKVIKLLPELQEVSRRIGDELKRATEVYETLKQEACGPALETLQSNGIEFSAKHFSSIVYECRF